MANSRRLSEKRSYSKPAGGCEINHNKNNNNKKERKKERKKENQPKTLPKTFGRMARRNSSWGFGDTGESTPSRHSTVTQRSSSTLERKPLGSRDRYPSRAYSESTGSARSRTSKASGKPSVRATTLVVSSILRTGPNFLDPEFFDTHAVSCPQRAPTSAADASQPCV